MSEELQVINLRPDDKRDVENLLDSVEQRFSSPQSAAFLTDVRRIAQELPLSVRHSLTSLHDEVQSSLLVDGIDINDVAINPTPRHWNEETPRTYRHEFALLLFGSVLGDVFGWRMQQAGRLVHNILPIPDHEFEQLGTSSSTELIWHTEDAFHPWRSDYVGLLCLRNPSQAATVLASIRQLRLDDNCARILFEPRFQIRPDPSYFESTEESVDWSDDTRKALQNIQRMQHTPECVPVLFGDRTSPYVRIDPAFMSAVSGDSEAVDALKTISARLDALLTKIQLQPGQILFIDNFRAVHGRRPFRATYDGHDRWLKRVNVTRDLRKSAGSRNGILNRVIF